MVAADQHVPAVRMATIAGVSMESIDVSALLSVMTVKVSHHFNTPIEPVWALRQMSSGWLGSDPNMSKLIGSGRSEGSAPSSAERIGVVMMSGRSSVMSPSATGLPGSLGRSSNPITLLHDGPTRWQ